MVFDLDRQPCLKQRKGIEPYANDKSESKRPLIWLPIWQ